MSCSVCWGFTRNIKRQIQQYLYTWILWILLYTPPVSARRYNLHICHLSSGVCFQTSLFERHLFSQTICSPDALTGYHHPPTFKTSNSSTYIVLEGLRGTHFSMTSSLSQSFLWEAVVYSPLPITIAQLFSAPTSYPVSTLPSLYLLCISQIRDNYCRINYSE